MRLGLVCISEILKSERKVSFKTMTRKQFLSLPRQLACATLSSRILHNFQTVEAILRHCSRIGIGHYRLSSNMMPLLTDEVCGISYNDLPDIREIRRAASIIGPLARILDITLSVHPDQFNVLASYSPDVVDRTIRELNHQSTILDMCGLSADYSCPMTLHLNCKPKGETPSDYADRFFQNLSRCEHSVQQRLVLENEDKGYWSCDKLLSHFGDRIPLVYDNLHDECNPSLTDEYYDNMFIATWCGYVPVFHWSCGINGTSKHADYAATVIPQAVQHNLDVTWEVEMKAKDRAIVKILSDFREIFD